MKNDLTDLMKKETLSGEELGLCLIKNDILRYTGRSDQCLDQETLDSLVQKIQTVEDAEILECYVQLQSFVQRSQAIANAFSQQAQNGCCRLLMYMTQSQQVEHARKLIENLPIIMTETQYREMKPTGRIARMRGVAIVAEGFPCRPKCLDANDYFIEPEIDCFQEMMSLENIEKISDRIKYFREDLLISGLKKHLAYNELYRLVGERIGLPDFSVFCVESDTVISEIKNINAQRNDFENELAGEGEEYANKKRILSEVFIPIDTEKLFPSEENKDRVREMLKDISSFRFQLDAMAEILALDKE